MANNQSYPQSVYPIAGDVQSVVGNQTVTVTGIQTVPVTNTAPASGQVLGFNGSAWTPTTPSSGGVVFDTPGQGAFIGPNLGELFPLYSNTSFLTAAPIGGTNDQLTVFQFKLPYSITLSRVSVIVGTAQATSSVNFGIYSAAGSKVLDSGAIATTSTGASSVTITPVPLTPAIYYFAQSASNTSVALQTVAPVSVAATNMMNALSVKIGQATNLTVSGVMPATLGALTADSVYAGIGCALFEV